jgi:hypothetical protein
MVVAVAAMTGIGLFTPTAYAGGSNKLDVSPQNLVNLTGERTNLSQSDSRALGNPCTDLRTQLCRQVRTQAELDAALADPNAATDIMLIAAQSVTIATKPANSQVRIFVHDTQPLYLYSVDVLADVQVTASGTAHVGAYWMAQVTALDNATVWAFDNSRVTASNAAIVYAWDSSVVEAAGNTRVNAYETAQVTVSEQAQVATPPGRRPRPSCKKIIGRGSSVRIWVSDTTSNLVEAEDPTTVTTLTDDELYLKGKWN